MRYLLTPLFALTLFSLSAQQLVLKPVIDSLAGFNAQQELIQKAIFKELAGMKRIRFLAEEKPDNPAANHLLDIRPAFSVDRWEFAKPRMVDSIQQIQIDFTGQLNAGASFACYNLESGKTVGVKSLNKVESWTKTFTLTYKEAGYAAGQRPSDYRAFERKLYSLVRTNYDRELRETRADKEKWMANRLADEAGAVMYEFFPFRLDLVEISKGKEKKAKEVIVSGGSSFDLRKGNRLAVYKTQEIEAKGRKFERLVPVGRLKFLEDHEKGGIADVLKGEKAISEEMTAGAKLYCNPGFLPVPISKERGGVRVAVSSFEAGAYTAKQRGSMFQRLQEDLFAQKNFSLVERQQRGLIEAEREFQKSADMIDKTVIDQYKSQGADLILAVRLGASEPKLVEDTDEQTGLTKTSIFVSIPVALKLVDVETGAVLNEVTYYSNLSRPISDRGRFDTEQARARDQACTNIRFSLKTFFGTVFPPTITISEIPDVDRDKADEVLLVGDVTEDVWRRYKVYRQRVIDVDGSPVVRLEEIGEVATRESEGEGLMSAKVKDGGKAILQFFNAGETLICADKPSVFEQTLNKTFKLASKINPALKD